MTPEEDMIKYQEDLARSIENRQLMQTIKDNTPPPRNPLEKEGRPILPIDPSSLDYRGTGYN